MHGKTRENQPQTRQAQGRWGTGDAHWRQAQGDDIALKGRHIQAQGVNPGDRHGRVKCIGTPKPGGEVPTGHRGVMRRMQLYRHDGDWRLGDGRLYRRDGDWRLGDYIATPRRSCPSRLPASGFPIPFPGWKLYPGLTPWAWICRPFRALSQKPPNHQPSNSPYAHFVSGGFTPPRGPQFGRTKVRPYIAAQSKPLDTK